MLRDLASIVGHGAEFRKIDIVAIEMRSPLQIRLSLFEIPPAAIGAFQEICLDVIRFRERDPRLPDLPGLRDAEAARLLAHVEALRRAPIQLTRVRVTKE